MKRLSNKYGKKSKNNKFDKILHEQREKFKKGFENSANFAKIAKVTRIVLVRVVTRSNPVEVLNFFQASLRNCINCVHCDVHFFIFIRRLSNDNGDGNENGKKAKGLDMQNNNFGRKIHVFAAVTVVVAFKAP